MHSGITIKNIKLIVSFLQSGKYDLINTSERDDDFTTEHTSNLSVKKSV